VIVCSVRALKLQGGAAISAKDPATWQRPDVAAVERGCANLGKHIENIRLFGLPAIVAINRFASDSDEEIAAVTTRARQAGAFAVASTEVWSRGGDGGRELAEAVVQAAGTESSFRHLYPLDMSIEDKVDRIARQVYGAARVEWSATARERLAFCRQEGLEGLPVCMAKTPLSLSHDPALKGRPEGFVLPIVDLRVATGAGYVYPLAGNIMTMPGLPAEPAACRVDVDADGQVRGLF